MKRGKLFLSAMALFLAVGSAWAVKSHKNFQASNVYTFNAALQTYVLIPCRTQGTGTCQVVGQKYTYNGVTFNTILDSQAHPTPAGQ